MPYSINEFDSFQFLLLDFRQFYIIFLLCFSKLPYISFTPSFINYLQYRSGWIFDTSPVYEQMCFLFLQE